MIKSSMKQRIRCFGYCLSLAIAVAVVVAPAGVAAGSLDEANMAYAEEEALTQVLDARLSLEKWTLDQFILLRREGNATWLEAAHQQSVVDTLQSERTATQQLVRFLDSLRDRVKQSCSGKSELRLADAPDDLPAIKLTLPGSERLVGWLEWDQASASMRASYLLASRASSVPPADVQKQIDLAADKLANYKQKVRQLAEITGSEKATNDLARAEVELAVARAELKLAHLMRQRQRSDSARFQRAAMYMDDDSTKEDSTKDEEADTTPPTDAALLVATDATYITHQSDSALRIATLSAAAQEARNQGALRAAEIDLRRLQRRADDMDQLNAAGLATRRDVQEAREEIDSAKALLENLQVQQSNLVNSYESLRQLADKDGFRTEPFRFASIPADATSAAQYRPQDWASLPMLCFTNATVVRHVIDLSRQRSQAEASRGALFANLKMLENLEARLAKAEKRLATRPAQASAFEMLEDMRTTLAEGRRRELENVRLNIELKKAQLLATTERLEVIRLETDRFAHQIIQQFNREDEFVRGSDLPSLSLPAGERFVARVANPSDAEVEHAVGLELGRLQRTPICYLESYDIFMDAKRFARSSAALGFVESAVAFQPIWLRPFRHVDPLALAPWQPSPPSVYDRAYYQLRLRYRNGLAYDPRRFTSPLASYFDEYDAFGGRRARLDETFRRFDRQRPVTYLPGTPARLPGAPRYLPGTPRRYEF